LSHPQNDRIRLLNRGVEPNLQRGFFQGQDTTPKSRLLTFADLQSVDPGAEPFKIEGFVIQIYACPPCPRGAMCKPCIGDHIVATDNPEEKDANLVRRLRIFTSKPEQFDLKKKYSFTVKLRHKAQKGRPIEEVELLRFDQVEGQSAPLDLITAANWRQHPEVKAVRSIVESINAGATKGVFKTAVRKFEYCEPYEDTLRKMAGGDRD